MKLFAFVLSLMFIPVFLQAQCNCDENVPACYGNSCNCSGGWEPWAMRTERVVVDEFPDCEFMADVCYRQCEDQPECVEMYICHFGVYPPWCNPCPEFLPYLESLEDFEKATFLRDMKIDFIRQIAFKWFEEFIEDPIISIDCETSEYRFKVTSYQTECSAYCITQHPNFDPTKETHIEEHPCSDSFCCKRILVFCENDDGTVNMTEVVDKDVTIDCNILSYPLRDCEPGANVFVTPCIDPCE